VFYDLEFQAVLGEDAAPEMTIGDLPPLAATSVGLVSYLEGGSDLPDGTPVAEVLITDAGGREQRHVLRAGTDTAEGLYTGDVAHRQARVGRHWRDNPAGNDYITRLELGPAAIRRRIVIRYLAPEGRLHVRGLSLIDARICHAPSSFTARVWWRAMRRRWQRWPTPHSNRGRRLSWRRKRAIELPHNICIVRENFSDADSRRFTQIKT